MKKIFLLRHAEASWSTSNNRDHDRDITDLGKEQAINAGSFLKIRSASPDFILTSDSRRTTQTMEYFCRGLGTEIDYRAEPYLFRATTEDIYTAIQETDPHYDCLLIINHNPTIHQVAMEFLSRCENEEQVVKKLSAGFAPAQLLLFETTAEEWEDFWPSKTYFTLKDHYRYDS